RNDKIKQALWPFKFSFNQENQPYVELRTHIGLKEFSLSEINKIFLEEMTKQVNTNTDEHDGEEFTKRAVITVSRYPEPFKISDPLIFSIIEAAKLANVEIIDIIEETHADLLYYFSHNEYSKKIEPG